MMETFALTGRDDDLSGTGSWPAPSRGESDFCSKEGAAALKAKIEAYWRERGQDVMLSLHNVGFHPAIRAARYDVRSDMVNGMPRSLLKTGARRGAGFAAPTPESPDDAFELNDEAAIA